MLPVLNVSNRSDEKRLCALFRKLNDHDQSTLVRFAEFMADSAVEHPLTTVLPEPRAIERPEQESVVRAIKRLTTTYPMISKDQLLHQTADMMSAHVINGRAAADVVDDLEILFAGHYQRLKDEFEQNC